MNTKLGIVLVGCGTAVLGVSLASFIKKYSDSKNLAKKIFEDDREKFETATKFINDYICSDLDLLDEFTYMYKVFMEMISDAHTPEKMTSTLDYIYSVYNNIIDIIDVRATDAGYKPHLIRLTISNALQDLKIKGITNDVERLSDRVFMNFSGNISSTIAGI